jgi:mannose-6-phosphate isomerase-like protein (cupin superfamily)
MGYELVDTGSIEPLDDREVDCVEVSDHFVPPPDDDASKASTPTPSRGPEQIGLRVYHAEPGEGLGGSDHMHSHEEQEETFYVVSGTLVVETPAKEYRIEAGQALVVEPGSPQRAFVPADADGPCHVIAIGAPSYSVLGRNDAKRYDP